MKNVLKILLLILILVSCKNQSNSGFNKIDSESKSEITQFEKREFNEIKKLKTIPKDLRKFGEFNFFDPDEIMRIWRFPEGGAVFEELIEIKRYGKEWDSTRYTYLLDEFTGRPEFQNFRRKQNLNLSKEEILKFTNRDLLQKNITPNKENQIFVSDMYLAEYRFNIQESFFEFHLGESGNSNSAKINLMTFLNKTLTE